MKTGRVKLTVTACPAWPHWKLNVAQSERQCQTGPGLSSEVHVTSAQRSTTDLLSFQLRLSCISSALWTKTRASLILPAPPVSFLQHAGAFRGQTPARLQAASASNSTDFGNMKYRRGSVPAEGRMARCWPLFASCTDVYSDRWLHFLKQTCLFM